MLAYRRHTGTSRRNMDSTSRRAIDSVVAAQHAAQAHQLFDPFHDPDFLQRL
jgi:hypothetical protein